MGPCSEDPHLCWASWLLGFTSLLLSVCSTGVKGSGAHDSGVQDSGAHAPLQGIRGGSVLFYVNKKQEAELTEVTWGFGPESNYRVLLQVRAGGDAPTWVSLQDKYQQRVHVPNMTTLKIENLTSEDSGQYRARASFTGGLEFNQVFLLAVYEPVPLPQILVHSSFITAGWCNVTLVCSALGDREDLKVTWESKGLPRELEWRETSGPTPNSWILTVNLSLSQPSASLTCVLSNQVDQKTATLDLEEDCVHGSHEHAFAGSLGSILWPFVMVLVFLGTGMCLWETCKKKNNTETETGAALQVDHRDHDDGIDCAELGQEESPGGTYKGISEHHVKEEWSLSTVYSVVHDTGQGMKIIH